MDAEAAAGDREQIRWRSGDQEWVTEWHPPDRPAPAGKGHGSSGVCVTASGDIVLISPDGEFWDLPGGRPEAGENWRETLDRVGDGGVTG